MAYLVAKARCRGGAAAAKASSLVAGAPARLAAAAAGPEAADLLAAMLDRDPYVAYRPGGLETAVSVAYGYRGALALEINGRLRVSKNCGAVDCSVRALKLFLGGLLLEARSGSSLARVLRTRARGLRGVPVATGFWSERGPRRSNQDSVVAGSLVLCDGSQERHLHVVAVADGAGGLSFGEQAGMIGVLEFYAGLVDGLVAGAEPLVAMREAVIRASRVVASAASTRGERMAATLTAYMVDVSSRILRYVNVGDTVLYLVEREQVRRLSVLHRTEMGGRQALTSFLGMETPIIHSGELGLGPGRAVVIAATDGVHDVVPPEDAAAAALSEESPRRAAQRIVTLAAQRGSRDNMTAAVTRLELS